MLYCYNIFKKLCVLQQFMSWRIHAFFTAGACPFLFTFITLKMLLVAIQVRAIYISISWSSAMKTLSGNFILISKVYWN